MIEILQITHNMHMWWIGIEVQLLKHYQMEEKLQKQQQAVSFIQTLFHKQQIKQISHCIYEQKLIEQ